MCLFDDDPVWWTQRSHYLHVKVDYIIKSWVFNFPTESKWATVYTKQMEDLLWQCPLKAYDVVRFNRLNCSFGKEHLVFSDKINDWNYSWISILSKHFQYFWSQTSTQAVQKKSEQICNDMKIDFPISHVEPTAKIVFQKEI